MDTSSSDIIFLTETNTENLDPKYNLPTSFITKFTKPDSSISEDFTKKYNYTKTFDPFFWLSPSKENPLSDGDSAMDFSNLRLEFESEEEEEEEVPNGGCWELILSMILEFAEWIGGQDAEDATKMIANVSEEGQLF